MSDHSASYREYTIEELHDALRAINAQAHPGNARALAAEIERRTNEPDGTPLAETAQRGIPRGAPSGADRSPAGRAKQTIQLWGVLIFFLPVGSLGLAYISMSQQPILATVLAVVGMGGGVVGYGLFTFAPWIRRVYWPWAALHMFVLLPLTYTAIERDRVELLLAIAFVGLMYWTVGRMIRVVEKSLRR